jgi:hypothetical protein
MGGIRVCVLKPLPATKSRYSIGLRCFHFPLSSR